MPWLGPDLVTSSALTYTCSPPGMIAQGLDIRLSQPFNVTSRSGHIELDHIPSEALALTCKVAGSFGQIGRSFKDACELWEHELNASNTRRACFEVGHRATSLRINESIPASSFTFLTRARYRRRR
jgi:hypothetical protein